MSKYPGRIVTDLAPAGYSVFFDGSGDFLSIAASSAFNFGAPSGNTNDFTIELWVYPTRSAFVDFELLYGTGGSGGQDQLNLYANGTAQYYDGTNNVISPVLRLNQWNHVAVVRNGASTNNLRVYANGVSGTAVTSTAALGSSATSPRIGLRVDNFNPLQGYISNVRVVKGTAIYTANFTPPTQLFNIPNTSLLTCNSPAIIDQSNNAFAITTNGNAAVSTLTPFTAYVPYNPALGASTPGVWTLDEALQAKGTRQWNMYDPRFNLTTLLLHGNGANNAQNNTFLDSSSNAFPITRNGNTTQGSFSPFSLQPGQWSNYFNGSSYLTAAANSGFSLAGDFTIEMWINPASLSTGNSIIIIESAAASGLYLAINAGTSTVNIFLNSSTASFIATPVSGISLNVWSHIALVRSGSTVTLYVNGVAASGTGSSAATLGSSTTPFRIGGFTGAYTGYISNLRVVNGRAVYTSNFTPSPSPLTATSGGQNPPTGTQTTLLTCQANRFVDAGGLVTPITISVAGGTPSVQAFSPFYPTAAYTLATVGGSGYFDGTSDYLSYATGGSAAFNLSTGDWTIEAWIYRNASGAGHQIINLFNSAGANSGLSFYVNSSNQLAQDNGVTATTAAGTVPANAWTHVAAVRSAGNAQLYVNGVAVGSAITQAPNTAQFFRIGITANDILPCNGYISGLRIIKGQALNSSGNFTPPTSPVTTTSVGWTGANVASSITGTVSLLTNFTNAGIVDSTAKNVLETVGNAQISTTQSVFGGTSMSFNGTNSTLLLRNSQLMNLGSSDFTLEFWMYRSAATASQPFYSLSGSSQTNSLALDMNASGGLLAYATASGGAVWSILNGSSFGTVPLTTWTHVALVRNGSTWRGYLNGVAGFTVTNSSALASFDGASIGSSGVSTLWFNGFIDDFRITRFARYTANFTPQTSQWQDE